MNARYIVELTAEEKARLVELLAKGSHRARRFIRAQVLLLANEGKAPKDILSALPTSSSTIYRCCRRFVEGGLDHALSDRSRPGGTRKLDAKDVATLVAIACSKAPSGPYTPRTNGKAERFIKTLLGEWAYVQPYSSSEERRQHLPPYVAFYNDERPHHSLGALPTRTRKPSQVS